MPGRRTKDKVDKTTDLTLATSNLLVPSPSSVQPEWSPRFNDPGSYSKAERLLGTSGLPYRPSSRQTSVPASPGYMTVTVSEASFGSEFTDNGSPTAVDEAGSFFPAKRPSMSNRPSSTILNNAYSNDRRPSNSSSISKHLHPKTSNSTMRSHYDAQNSPLYISQQTSDSAVRDRALRKGKPPVAPAHNSSYQDHANGHVPSPLSRQLSDDIKKDNRKPKPHKLDLSILFPKPRANGKTTLLSPNKLVNSPSAMSTASEYFPRPMTRVPTPVQGQAKLTKTAKRQQTSDSPLKVPTPTSPVRLHKRDEYDSAKVNVRRPPRGIQHWFDAVGDSDEESEEEEQPIHAPRSSSLQAPQHSYMVPPPGNSSPSGRFYNSATSSQQTLRSHQQHGSHAWKEQHAFSHPPLDHNLNSPSLFSVRSRSSLTSNKTKDSAFSKSNLQDSSVLSFSSSEDEDNYVAPVANRYTVRSSIEDLDDGEIIIGKAQAFEMQRPRPGHTRKAPSEGKLSIMSTSTNAATIEVMYTPEPYSPHLFPRPYGSRRSSHIRQPSVINEDEEVRPKTASNRPASPTPSASVRSVRTSTSEPQSRAEQHKLMAVTAEEEALLEMMRKKRAAMAKNSFTEGYKTAVQQEVLRQVTPPEAAYRTSAFLFNETPSTSPAQGLTITTSSRKSSLLGSASPHLMAPRGRPTRFGQDRDSPLGTSVLRDSSSCDDRLSERHILITPTSHPHHLAPPPEFSPLDPFPSSTPTASMASPTTTEHPSPLPSPITPGHRHGESDVDVKVAGSEPSCNGDDEPPILDNNVIEQPVGSIKTDESRSSQVTITSGQHTRRRTASSGADMTFNLGPSSFPVPPTSRDLTPLPENGSRPPSISISTSSFPMPDSGFGFPMPNSSSTVTKKIPLPRKSSRRTSALTVNTAVNSPVSVPRIRHPSTISTGTSSSVTVPDRRSSRIGSFGGASGGSSLTSLSSMNSRLRDSVRDEKNRNSVSEDVLAAWGSLGGV
jgi:hypothetical protein